MEVKNPLKIIFLVLVIILTNLKSTKSEKDNFQGLWFDTGLKFQAQGNSKQHSLVHNQGLPGLATGLLYNLMSSSSSSLPQPKKNTYTITYQCLNDTEKLIADITSGQPYAIQFLDADGKLPPGALQGSWSWVGDYQECKSIDSILNEITRDKFSGKYFSVALYRNEKPLVNEMLPLMIGACLPDSCDISDAKGLAEIAFEPFANLNVSVAYVIEDNKPPYDGAAIATFVLAGIIGILVLLGTAADLWSMYKQTSDDKHVFMNGNTKRLITAEQATERTGLLADDVVFEQYVVSKKDKLISFLLCFSFINNTKKLLNTSTAKGPLACLNGLRVISMWWVIQGHTYSFTTLNLDNSVYAGSTIVKRFTFQPILNGTFSVDSFFFLSGLLVAYLALKEIQEKGKLSWVYYFLHRYWRLTPLYAFTLLTFMSMTVYLLTGPFQWLATDPQHGPLYEASQGCRDYWWSNLLYINNFYPDYGADSGCMGWAWYLANDMQFYIFISPILILAFKYNKLAGTVLSIFLILACIGIRAFLVSWYGITMLSGTPSKHTDDPWGKQAMYVRPWARMSVYIVGFLTGFVLQHLRCRLRLNKFCVFIGWCVSTSTALAVIYGMFYYSSHPGTHMTLVASGFYVSLSRTAWALSLSWLVLACASGYGGPVNWVLSWQLWAPLGRLTYAAYLVHPIVLVLYQFNLLKPLHFTDLTLIYMFVANLVFSYLTAYVVSMAVEAPMMATEKLMLNKRRWICFKLNWGRAMRKRGSNICGQRRPDHPAHPRG